MTQLEEEVEDLQAKLEDVEHQAKLKAQADKASYVAIFDNKEEKMRLQFEHLEVELLDAREREEELLEIIQNLEVSILCFERTLFAYA